MSLSIAKIRELELELIAAIKVNDVPEAARVLESGISPDFEYTGVPILLYAAQRELWPMVEELYMANANMDATNELSGWTFLHQLVAANRIKEVHQYIDFIDRGYAKEFTKEQDAFMLSVDLGHREIFDVLVEKEFEFRAKDKENNNVFHYVAKAGWIDVLNKHGEKNFQLLSATNKSGETPLSLAGLTISDLSFEKQSNESVKANEPNVESVEEASSVEATTEAKPKLGKLKGAKRL